MIEEQSFYAGLGIVGLQLNQPVRKDVARAFYLALEDETTAEEWQAFVRVAVKRFAWTFLPPVPALLDALRVFRGAPRLEAEAVLAYERVLESGSYGPEGTYWHFREIAARCGAAAAEAFLEAGGHSAFCASDGGGYRDTERQKRFVSAYQAAARVAPSGRLLPAATPQRFLPAGERSEAVAFRPIGRGEAADLLAKTAGLNASENEGASR